MNSGACAFILCQHTVTYHDSTLLYYRESKKICNKTQVTIPTSECVHTLPCKLQKRSKKQNCKDIQITPLHVMKPRLIAQSIMARSCSVMSLMHWNGNIRAHMTAKMLRSVYCSHISVFVHRVLKYVIHYSNIKVQKEVSVIQFCTNFALLLRVVAPFCKFWKHPHEHCNE